MTIIGIGDIACEIVEKFSSYKNHKYIVKISTSKQPKIKKCKNILFPKFKEPEEYENACPNISKFINRKEKTIKVFIDGKDTLALSSLQILHQIDKKQDTEVIYLCPDMLFLGIQTQQIHNLVFNVLQEYARSGMFKSLCLISYENIEKIAQKMHLSFFDNIFPEIVGGTIYTIDQLKSINSIYDNFVLFPAACRIKTLSIINPENLIHQNFFDLDNISDVVYYFSYNESQFKTNKNLVFDVREIMKNKLKNNHQRVYYGIFASEYNEPFICCEYYTSLIQQSPEI